MKYQLVTSILFGYRVVAQDFSFFERIMSFSYPIDSETSDSNESDVKFSELTVSLDGNSTTVYISGCEVLANSYPPNSFMKCFHNNGGKMYTKPNLDPENLFMPNLLNGSLEFDVELGN